MKRYKIECDDFGFDEVEDEDGYFVHAADVAALERELSLVRAQLSGKGALAVEIALGLPARIQELERELAEARADNARQAKSISSLQRDLRWTQAELTKRLNESEALRWYRVEDGVPVKDRPVLVSVGGGRAPWTTSHDGRTFRSGGASVTHWMELPRAPLPPEPTR